MDGSDLISVLVIALGLAADCFAVALSGSAANRTLTRWQASRAAVSFGLFQALMPVIGWLAGRTVVDFIEHFDHWVAFGLLVLVGARMLRESFHKRDKNQKKIDITRGLMLLTLSLATSIDALAVGLSFAFIEVNIWLASPIIGATSFIISLTGFAVGKKAGEVLGKRAELIGGIVLIGIGVRILLSHLL